MGPAIDENTNEIPQFGRCAEGANYVNRPGAYVVLHDAQGRIAVIDAGGDIHLPGGGMEENESPADAARREALEEIGIEVRLGRQIGQANQFGYSAVAGTHFNKLCTYFLATPVADAVPVRSAEHEVIWMSPAEAIRTLVHESHAWAVRRAEQFIAASSIERESGRQEAV